MSYLDQITIHDDYVSIEMSGIRVDGQEVDQAIQVWQKMSEICEENDIKKILAISRITGSLPIGASYKIAQIGEELGWNRKVKLAFVELNEDSFKDNSFTETTAVNRGYQVKIFRTVDEKE